MGLQIRRLSYCLGAEIIGLDIPAIDERTFREVQAAFLEHAILLLRDQALTREQHIAFSRRFGELDRNEDSNPLLRIPEYPEILLVSNKPKPGVESNPYKQGDGWHSDRSFSLVPAMASLLRSVEIPDLGGDTLFCNLYLAYESLSDGMKKLIDGLHGVHFGGKARVDTSTPERAAESKRKTPPVAQPSVRTHPETGRKSLYLGNKIQQLVGLNAEESKPLITFLCEHATRPQFVYRHRWRKDDLVIWDNRCTNHIALGDYDNSKLRHMERTTVNGTPSGYVYDGPLHDDGPRL